MKISVKFIDEDGSEAIKPVVIDTSVPGFDDFHDVNDFLPVFHQLEQTGLELRDETFSTALTHYLEERCLKKLPQQPVIQRTTPYIIEAEAGRLALRLYESL